MAAWVGKNMYSHSFVIPRYEEKISHQISTNYQIESGSVEKLTFIVFFELQKVISQSKYVLLYLSWMPFSNNNFSSTHKL